MVFHVHLLFGGDKSRVSLELWTLPQVWIHIADSKTRCFQSFSGKFILEIWELSLRGFYYSKHGNHLLFEEDSHFDWYFSNGLNPPARTTMVGKLSALQLWKLVLEVWGQEVGSQIMLPFGAINFRDENKNRCLNFTGKLGTRSIGRSYVPSLLQRKLQVYPMREADKMGSMLALTKKEGFDAGNVDMQNWFASPLYEKVWIFDEYAGQLITSKPLGSVILRSEKKPTNLVFFITRKIQKGNYPIFRSFEMESSTQSEIFSFHPFPSLGSWQAAAVPKKRSLEDVLGWQICWWVGWGEDVNRIESLVKVGEFFQYVCILNSGCMEGDMWKKHRSFQEDLSWPFFLGGEKSATAKWLAWFLWPLESAHLAEFWSNSPHTLWSTGCGIFLALRNFGDGCF